VRIDAGRKPSELTIREYRTSARDLLIWMALRGLCPADAGPDDLKQYKAFLQADGAALEMERMRAAWYRREPRITIVADWRGIIGLMAFQMYRGARGDAAKAQALGQRGRRLVSQADGIALGCVASLSTLMATFAKQPARIRHESYGDDTVALRITMARSFYKMALSRNCVFANPLLEIKVGKGHTSRGQKIMSRFFSDKEVLDILDELSEDRAHTPRGKAAAARDTAMIRLARNQGLRISEIASLDLDDFNPSAGEQGSLTLRHAKGNKERTVLLTEKTRLSLDRWLQYRSILNPLSDAVFVSMHWGNRTGSEPGNRLTTRSIRAMFDEAQQKIGVKRDGRSVHGLRHSYATRALMEDENQLVSLMASMGHGDMSTMMPYLEVSQFMAKNPAKLSEI
jgi:site-specific recombinase XerD